MASPESSPDTRISKASPLRALFFEKVLSDGLPLFENSAALAEALAELNGTNYPNKRSSEALLSQIFRCVRPVPTRLITDIIALLSHKQTHRSILLRESPTEADILQKAEQHNEEVRRSSNDEARFSSEICDFRTQVVFASEAIFTLSRVPTSTWNKLIQTQLRVLLTQSDAKLTYYATSKTVAYRLWDAFSEVARQLDTSSINLATLKNANETGRIKVHVLDRQLIAPWSILPQVAFFPKSVTIVYTFIGGERIALNDEDAAYWRTEYHAMIDRQGNTRDITWADYFGSTA